MFTSEAFGGLIPGAQGTVLRALLRTGAGLTGRQLHRVIDQQHSLTAVQSALRTLAEIGLVDTEPVGRAMVHRINLDHAAVPTLRQLMEPREILAHVVSIAVQEDSSVRAVLLFGSAARGEANRNSDVDLAVVTEKDSEWTGRADLQATVEREYGGHCDVVSYGAAQLNDLVAEGSDPVAVAIARDQRTLYESQGTKLRFPSPAPGALDA